MNEHNKIMALLLGEHYHEPFIYPSGEKSRYKCSDINCPFHDHQSLDPLSSDNPIHADSEGWMEGETIRKIQEKMPGTWNKYGIYCGNEVREMQGINLMKALEYMLSLSNFINYLRDNREWAYILCDNPDCKKGKVLDATVIIDCPFCDGTGKIINPKYVEVLKEMDNE